MKSGLFNASANFISNSFSVAHGVIASQFLIFFPVCSIGLRLGLYGGS